MASGPGWNLWVWLPCIGVVSVCCCITEVYRYPHNKYKFSLLHLQTYQPLSYRHLDLTPDFSGLENKNWGVVHVPLTRNAQT